MPEFRIEPMPSRNLQSEKVVYYVRSLRTNTLVTKFDSNTKRAEDIDGWEKFTAAEKLELQNYLAGVRFTIDVLTLSARQNRDYRFILPTSLQEALTTLYEKACENNIIFNPMAAMLSGLLQHIATTEKRLHATGEPSVLANYNINLNYKDKNEKHKLSRKYIKKIFKHLHMLRGGLENYAKIASDLYGYETNLNNTTLLKYIEGTSKPSQWAVSCALSVIGEKEEISSFVPLPQLIDLWLTPLKFSGKIKTSEQAFTIFQQYFKRVNNTEAKLYIEKLMEKSI